MEYSTGNCITSYNGTETVTDADGNLVQAYTESGKKEYVYDSRNRLVKTSSSQYTYDDENYRIKSGTEEYCYDRQNKNLLVRYAKDGSIEKYVYGNGLISSEKTGVTVENSNTADAKTDGTKTETAGTLTVYHCDLRGSVRAVTDQTGTVTDRYSYSLYGERTHDTGDGDHIFGYCGRDGVITERDGLLYMRARYYSPELKRFISADSVIGNLSSTPSLNRYAYANGNPVTQIDPFGLSAEPGTKKAKKNINWREAVHDALDIAGSITGYGDICDAVNAVLYLTEGDYINAGLSALSIIPGADAFTKTGKASKVLGNGIVESGLKHLDNVADGIKKLVKKADDAIDLEKHLPKKLLTEEAEAFAKKADKVADDVVEDAAKAIKSGKPTRRQSFRQAKEAAGIPKSAQYKHHEFVYDGSTENRIVYEFEVNGKSKYVIEHPFDKNGRGNHFHGADDKYGSPYNKGTYNQYDGHFPEDFDGFE